MDDLEFIQRCASGDKQAWDEFVDKYSRLIYNYIYSVLKTKGLTLAQENIEELFQEIFFSLIKDDFKKLKSFRGLNGCSFASWLRQVTVNFSIDYIRKIKTTVSLDQEDEEGFSLKDILTDNSLHTADVLEQEESYSNLTGCIEGLDNDDKYFLELYINRRVSLEELSRFFKISRGAVDMRKARIINKLRECFKSKGFFKLES